MLTADSDRISPELDTQDDALAGDVALKTADGSRSDAASCSNCHQPLPKKGLAVCPHCGYYPILGICVDLDKEWERLNEDEAVESQEPQGNHSPKSHLQVWIDLIPGWGWTLIGYNAAILLLSVFARLFVPSGFSRTLWSVSQLLIGVTVLLTCHCIAYLISIADDASMNVLDIVLKPLRLWRNLLRELPRTFRLTAGGSCGATAAVGSILIIGSLPYGRLLDWGIQAPPQKNLVSAILAQAQDAEDGEEGLEESIDEFSGTAGEITADELADGLAGKDVEKNVHVDCVIVGYTVDKENPNAISSLIIGREFQGTLKFAGSLYDGLTDEVRYDLLEDLVEVTRERPFINVPPHVLARWVQPKFICRVKCVRETKSGDLVEMEFEDMLGAVKY